MDEETIKSLLGNYFERKQLIFLSAIPVNEGGNRIMYIEFSCDQGIYRMKLFEDLRLFCENRTRKKWIEIKKYGGSEGLG